MAAPKDANCVSVANANRIAWLDDPRDLSEAVGRLGILHVKREVPDLHEAAMR